MTAPSVEAFEFDVALSFAGEDRHYVQGIAELLKRRGVRIFYDEYVAAHLWGQDLYATLDEVYRKRARFAIIFVSRHYVSKPWTQHERMSAQARAVINVDPYLLPVRIDDSELPGLRPTIGYIDARTTSQEQLVDLIKQKLSSVRGEVTTEPAAFRVPRTTEQQRELLAQRPPAWEYLLFGGVLWQRREALEEKWRDHELGYAGRTGQHYSNEQVFTFLSNSLNDLSGGPQSIERMLSLEVQERAFGAPGEPGNPELIEHIAKRIVGAYEQMMDVAAELRGAGVPEELSDVMEATARLTDHPLEQIRDFIDQIVAELDTVPERIARGEELQISMDLIMAIDEAALRYQAEVLEQARRRLDL
ncbi:toll/interleukin-1 receptor domain-containing protein [Streptomyces sp. FIT100]|uniref:toll/interleukin-1 receptor domain-containing protein n=1 Tax=Streptomyces sp. FIT100 TaxID=2837956 RepID=UPI0021C9DF09|nr:TIR domain-containing protein [Streptomyces sp. FIT100]UUN27837.1 TIR domain-containing protein [Streptomyces sp. FIT100]